jgi:mannitol/fructose-specific phosphotransferase system IIA component (Ntr-type)/predicted transcriptional regulator
MKISSLLDPRLVKCGLSARTKEEALDEIVQVMAGATPGVSAAELRAALAEREKLGPFSMAKGGAFPHARTESVSDFRIAVGTAPEGLDFKAPDGNLVRVVVLFAVPKKHSDLYLQTLGQFLNLFSVGQAARRIVKARTPEELVAAVDAASSRPTDSTRLRAVPCVTGRTPLSGALEVMSSNNLEAVPVVDAEGNLVGELASSALLGLGAREKGGPPLPLEEALRAYESTPLEGLDVIATSGYCAVQEDELLVEMAAKLSTARARTAYVLRGRKLVGTVSTADVLRRLSGGN